MSRPDAVSLAREFAPRNIVVYSVDDRSALVRIAPLLNYCIPIRLAAQRLLALIDDDETSDRREDIDRERLAELTATLDELLDAGAQPRPDWNQGPHDDLLRELLFAVESVLPMARKVRSRLADGRHRSRAEWLVWRDNSLVPELERVAKALSAVSKLLPIFAEFESEFELKLRTAAISQGTSAASNQSQFQVESPTNTSPLELTDSQMRALQQYERAIEADPSIITDRQAYEWLRKHSEPGDNLPNFDAWRTHLSRVRTKTGTQKRKRRLPAPNGHSIVSANQI